MKILDRSKQPEIQEIPFPSLLPIEKRELSNGVEMYVLRGGTQEIVEIDIITKSGTLFSERGFVARPTADLLGEGAGKYTSKDLASLFDFYGVMVSGSAGTVTSELTLVGLTKYMDKCLEGVEMMVKNPHFPQKELELYVETRRQKFLTQMQKTKYRASRLAKRALFSADSRYSRVLELSDIESLNRDMLQAFHAKMYIPQGAKIIVSGLPDEALLRRIEQIFGDTWKGGNAIETNLMPSYSDDVKMIFDEYDAAKQNTIYMTTKMPTMNDPDCMYLDILNMVFGGYFGSRLMTNIREEKGLTYGISSSYSVNNLSGSHVICSNVKSDMYELVVDEIWKEMKKLCEQPICKEELDVVKNYIRGNFLQNFDNVLSVVESYKSLILTGKDMSYYRRRYDVLNNVTAEDLMRVAQKYYKQENYHVVISGKRKESLYGRQNAAE